LEVNGVRYDVSCFFTADDDTGHVWQVLDLVKQDLGDHYRITIGPDGVLCDCPAGTYRPQAVCKHAAAVTEALDQLERLEQAERLLDEAQAALDQLAAIGPPPNFDPFTV
jgi:hypothetical protein